MTDYKYEKNLFLEGCYDSAFNEYLTLLILQLFIYFALVLYLAFCNGIKIDDFWLEDLI